MTDLCVARWIAIVDGKRKAVKTMEKAHGEAVLGLFVDTHKPQRSFGANATATPWSRMPIST